MIGRLLQSAASTFGQHGASRPPQHPYPPGLESVTEESHTRDLLFPDPAALRANLTQHQQHGLPPDPQLLLGSSRPPATARDAANFDDRGDLDISFPADVRLIIAQDANGRYHQPQVLYDSKPVRGADPAKDSSPTESPRHQRTLSRGKSMTSPATPNRHRHTPSGSLFPTSGLLPNSPLSPRSPEKPRAGPADQRSRSSPFDQILSEAETAQGKIAREAKEETEALLGCMFGAPGFRLEPGTKLHILPKKTSDAQYFSKSPNSNRPISSGGFQRKRTPLVRSTSVADVSRGDLTASGSDGPDSRTTASKPSIMFTRLFTVSVPETVASEQDDRNGNGPESPTQSRQATDGDPQKPKQPKQKKVPMYAIAAILHLPPEVPHRLRQSTSQQGLYSLASSLNDSTPATSWRGDQGVFASFMEIRSHGPFDSVLNSHLPQVLLHWNIVNRSLELMEQATKAKLGVLLEDITPFTPFIPAPDPRPGVNKVRKPNKTTQQSVYVPAGCLQDDAAIRELSESTSQRLVGGLRTRRVVVGQCRWGAWREEARWIGRWAGGRDQNFFLFNVLTAFLGIHTDWLEKIAPRWYRKRRRAQRMESNAVRARTVVVSADKMAARRLIFLLAAFLPGHPNQYQTLATTTAHSIPIPYSESPPASGPRDNGLRRTNTHKSSLGRSSGAAVASGHARSVSFSLAQFRNEDAGDDSKRSRGRRDSDAKSLKSPSLVIPHPGGSESRKASTSTVIAEGAQAVPHFSNLSLGESANTATDRQRPGSGASLASLALSHNLKRSESVADSTAGSGRWGSVVSGFWSNRRDSSTDDSDVFASSQESPRRTKFPTPPPHQHHEHRHSVSGLERMVEEATALRGATPPSSSLLSGSPRRRPLQLEECLKPRALHHPALTETSAGARQIPRPKRPERLPLKLSFNEDEGFIDIAMEKEPSFSSSLASSFTSVRHPGTAATITPGFASTPGGPHEHFSPYGSTTSDSGPAHSEPALDVAGWLKAFQPDFVLQAVRPYDELMADVQAALRAEALLDADCVSSDDESDDRHPNGGAPRRPAADSGAWHHVSDALVADASRFTVERVRVQRRRRQRRPSSSSAAAASARQRPQRQHAQGPHPQPQQQAQQAGEANPAAAASDDPRFEVRVTTEPVMALDTALTEAVERVLALSGANSRAGSPQRNHGAAGDGGATHGSDGPSRTSDASKTGGYRASRANSVNKASGVSAGKANSASKANGASKASGASQVNGANKANGTSQVNGANKANGTSKPNGRAAGKAAPADEATPAADADTDGSSSPLSMPSRAGAGADGPSAETRRVVLGALEDVVRSVLDERERDAVASPTGQRARRPRSAGDLGGGDGSLRDGVRRWLAEVERGDA